METPEQQKPADAGKPALPNILSYAPIIISFISLLVSLYTLHEGIKRDRAAAEPGIGFSKQLAYGNDPVALTLKNYGNGTATVSGYTLYVDGQPVLPSDDAAWDRVKDTMPAIFHGNCPMHGTIVDGQKMATGQYITLLAANQSDVDPGAIRTFIHDRLIVKVHVCSSYGDCTDVCSTGDGTCSVLDNPPAKTVIWRLGKCARLDHFID